MPYNVCNLENCTGTIKNAKEVVKYVTYFYRLNKKSTTLQQDIANNNKSN